jgi:hypothetical protein
MINFLKGDSMARFVILVLGVISTGFGLSYIFSGNLFGMVNVIMGIPMIVFVMMLGKPQKVTWNDIQEHRKKHGDWGDNPRGFTPLDKM